LAGDLTVIVISTTGTPHPYVRARCLHSVASQSVEARHVYLELPERPADGFPHFPALARVISELPDDEIVVSLDGDDWLLPGALEIVQNAHDAGALVTYGSFVYADGRPGFAQPIRGPIRSEPWTATHLKTFRAGLFRRIRITDLKDPTGLWLENARDQALMFPLVEMAGPRAVYIPHILSVYNAADSDEHVKGAPFIAAERAASDYLRSLPSYPCVT
jgi:hypothetical protein